MQNSQPSLVRGTAIVSSLTLLSRVLGFFRDLLVARVFGAGLVADAFFVAFRIPNLLRSFVAEGAMTSAFVPVFTSELKKGHDAALRAIRSISGLLLGATTLLTALGMIFANDIIELMAPGFGRNPEQHELCIALTRVMMPFVICISFVALLNGALNALGIFGSAAMAQVWMNLCLIVGGIVAQGLGDYGAAQALSWSVLAGGLVQVLTQLPALRKSRLSILPSLEFFSPASRHMLALIGPALIGATVYQFGVFLNTVFASVLETGSVSWLFYADRLVQLPIGIFSIALASVLLPSLSHAQAAGDQQRFSRELGHALRSTSFVILPVAFGLFFFAAPLTHVVFERGAFSPVSTANTALAIQAYAFGVWATSCHSMIVRGFIAQKNTRTPVLIGFLSLTSIVVFSLLLMGPPKNHELSHSWALLPILTAQQTLANIFGTFELGHAGLAAASSAGSLVALLAAAVLFARTARIEWGKFALSTARVALISWAAIGGAAFAVKNLSLSTQLFAGAPLAMVLFATLCALTRCPEFSEALAIAKRAARRGKVPSPATAHNEDPK